MLRLLLIAVIVFLLVLLFMRQKLYRSRIERQGELECGWDGRAFAERFMERVPQCSGVKGMPSRLASGRSPAELAEVAWLLALEMLRQDHQKVLRRRDQALRRAKLIPAFAALVLGMSVIGLKFRPSYAIMGFLLVSVLSQIPVWLSQIVDREAAALATSLIRDKRLFARIRDEEKVLACLKAFGWKRLLPFG